MANEKYFTTQGQAWDQIALAKIGSELRMDAILPENPEEADALLFAGDVELTVPKIGVKPVKSLPPWEKM